VLPTFTGSSLQTDGTNMYYASGAGAAPGGALCLMGFMKVSIASGESRVLVDDYHTCGEDLAVSGGRLYWTETAAIAANGPDWGKLQSVSVDGGPVVTHRSWRKHGASATHLYWVDGATMLRRPLSGDSASVVLRDVGDGHFIEANRALYWIEKVRPGAGEGGLAAGRPAAANAARLIRLGVNDPNPGTNWRLIPGADVSSSFIHGDEIYWEGAKCQMSARLDGADPRCVVGVKKGARIFDDDYAYWTEGLVAIVRSPVRRGTPGTPETIVRCDGRFSEFVVASGTVFFENSRVLWSMSTMPSRTRPASDATDSTPSHSSP
jgi:hypothetical protein